MQRAAGREKDAMHLTALVRFLKDRSSPLHDGGRHC